MPETPPSPAPTPVAAPAPVPTPTPAPAPTTTPAPAAEAKTGIFDHLAIAQPETKPATTETTESKTEPTTQPTPVKLYADRYKTPEELEVAFRESTSEGLRLYQELRSATQALEEMKAQFQELKDQRSIPPFRELSKEDLEKLPIVDQINYIADKKLHDRDAEASKVRMQRERSDRQARDEETGRFIIERGRDLSTHPDKYPHYLELEPQMEAMSKRIGNDLRGKGWAPDLLYLAALGQKHLQGLRAGKAATDASRTTAKTAAEATATATLPGGASTTPTTVEDKDSDQAVMERIMKAGTKTLFKV